MTAHTAEPDAQPPLLDDARLAELQDMLGEVLEDVLRAWLGDARQTLVDARAAFVSARPAPALDLLHTLKGSSANVGAARLAAAARRLEQAARSGVLDETALLKLLTQLDALYEQTAVRIAARLDDPENLG